jgi:hypothetical protein
MIPTMKSCGFDEVCNRDDTRFGTGQQDARTEERQQFVPMSCVVQFAIGDDT